MTTTQHCNEDAITAYLLGMLEAQDAAHAAACPECSARMEHAQAEMEQLRTAAEKLTSRPEHFWDRQRVAILDRIAPARSRFARRWLWAPGAALAVLALVLFSSPTQVRKPGVVAPDNGKDDDLLLTQIEDDVQRPVARALEPAALLVRARNDMARSSRRYSSQGVQE